MTKFFVFNGFGNYSDCFGWDNGLCFSEPTLMTSAEIEEAEDLLKIPNEGELVEWFSTSYGGSRNVTIIVASDSLESAIMIAKNYAASYEVVDYDVDEGDDDEEKEESFDVVVCPNSIYSVSPSGGSWMGSRYDYVANFSSEEEAIAFCDERND